MRGWETVLVVMRVMNSNVYVYGVLHEVLTVHSFNVERKWSGPLEAEKRTATGAPTGPEDAWRALICMYVCQEKDRRRLRVEYMYVL